jgi:hypothetical protein
MHVTITEDDFTAVKFDSTLLRGSSIPPQSLGVNGDYYLNRTTGYLYHKSGGSWNFETSLTGPAGKSNYTYVVYASDNLGSNFSDNWDPALDYIAILESHTQINNLNSSYFVGLWKCLKSGETSNILQATASENLLAGAFVNLYGIAGSYFVKNANASNSDSPATGFVLSAFTLGSVATVQLSGMNTSLTGLVPESTYYLSTIDGKISLINPDSVGSIIQTLGIAVSDTTLDFDSQEIIVNSI